MSPATIKKAEVECVIIKAQEKYYGWSKKNRPHLIGRTRRDFLEEVTCEEHL